MRHLIANITTYTIGILLVLGAVLFAWMRAAQLRLSDETTVFARFEPEPAHEFEWRELGAQSYVSNCATCHLRDGSGWDQYPGVAHSARLAAAPGGRDYLVDLHLYGLTSDRWRAPMPPMGHIRDVEMAAVLNHLLTNFGNNAAPEMLYTPADVAARRGRGLRPADVNDARPDVPVPR